MSRASKRAGERKQLELAPVPEGDKPPQEGMVKTPDGRWMHPVSLPSGGKVQIAEEGEYRQPENVIKRENQREQDILTDTRDEQAEANREQTRIIRAGRRNDLDMSKRQQLRQERIANARMEQVAQNYGAGGSSAESVTTSTMRSRTEGSIAFGEGREQTQTKLDNLSDSIFESNLNQAEDLQGLNFRRNRAMVDLQQKILEQQQREASSGGLRGLVGGVAGAFVGAAVSGGFNPMAMQVGFQAGQTIFS